jgi:hypothetical protein
MRKHELVYALNAGGVDPDALSRVDLESMRLAGEHPVANLLPNVLGPAGLRPGTQSLFRITGDPQTRSIKFERSTGNSYILLMSPGEMRVVSSGAIVQVPAVATAINSGSWTNVSTAPATAVAGPPMVLTATKVHKAKIRQTVTVASGDQNMAHVLRVDVTLGPVYVRVGTTAGGQELLRDAALDTGIHKIAFTPTTGTIYVEISSVDTVSRIISTVQFESTLIGGTGDLVIPTPWSTWAAVQALRVWQSIDVMFIGDGLAQPRRITHRGIQSWGLELYKTDDGPFVAGSDKIALTPSATRGNITITASESYFETGHVGALIEITQTSKVISDTLAGNGQATDYITVVGVGTPNRQYVRGSTQTAFIGRLVIERSFDPGEPSSWSLVQAWVDAAATVAPGAVVDPNDNMTVHYRYRVDNYTSGSVAINLNYDSGVATGIARITGYTSPTQVSAEVVSDFGNNTSSYQWRIGDWSQLRGWPRIPVIHDSRLHWFRKDYDFGSYVDDYTNFDDNKTGDSATFTRSVGSGGEDGVIWAVSENRLLAGTPSFEAAIAASELDEPLTPTAYTVRKISRRGCADIEPAVYDEGLFYVQRSGRKLYKISMDASRYKSQYISRLNPKAYASGISRVVVQQQPDTRIYSVMSDGTMTVLTHEPDDKVVAITTISLTGGLIEDVCVLSGADQDDVYVVVNRSGARYVERFAKESDQRSVSTCALLDAHKVLTGSVSSITGGTHLAGQTVQVWADGQRRADVTLNGSGVAALEATYSRVVYGKSYQAVFKSVKLAYAAQLGTAVGQTKIVKGVALVLSNSCLDGIRVGRDASNLEPLPDIFNGAVRTKNQFFAHYDQDVMPINSTWDTDARVYLTVDSAEGPFTAQAMVIDIETQDGVTQG